MMWCLAFALKYLIPFPFLKKGVRKNRLEKTAKHCSLLRQGDAYSGVHSTIFTFACLKFSPVEVGLTTPFSNKAAAETKGAIKTV